MQRRHRRCQVGHGWTRQQVSSRDLLIRGLWVRSPRGPPPDPRIPSPAEPEDLADVLNVCPAVPPTARRTSAPAASAAAAEASVKTLVKVSIVRPKVEWP